MLLSNGENALGSPFRGGGSVGPWGLNIDGADNIWVADFTGQRLLNFCGARPENCPPGFETGDPISPDGTGYNGGGVTQHLTDAVIDQAGNVWVANNVKDPEVCFFELMMSEDGCMQPSPDCGGNGLVVFYGLAAPVEAPVFGPPREP